MKKIHSLSILSISLISILLGGIFFLLSSQDDTTSQNNLAQEQEVISIPETKLPKKEVYLSPKKQKQLNKIKEFYLSEQSAHHTLVTNIMRKYNSNFSQDDEKILLGIIEEVNSPQEFTKAIKERLALRFLQTDIRKILQSKNTLADEKQLELTRLKLFQERNNQELHNNIQNLIELSIKKSFNQNTTLTPQEITKISGQVTSKLFEGDINILNLDSFEKQETLLKDSISLSLKTINSLSLGEKQALIITTVEDIFKLEILATPKENTLSFFPISPTFENIQKLGFLIFPKVNASEPSVATPEELAILILKAEIFIERILQESIETEILYNTGSLTQQDYENIIEANLIELEELVILKESLENDPNNLSLSDIQRFHLGAYVDDSQAIQDLPVLAYIQNKTGHVIIYNLNGSAKLGEENLSLYSGYGIETLDNSSATLIFSDESILRLDGLSRVDITTPQAGNINVSVERGAIWTRVLKPLLSGDIFTINSDGVSLGVRGTSLSLIQGPTNTIVNIVDSYTSNGSPSVILTDDSGNQNVASGKEISIDKSTGNTNLSDMSRAELLNSQPQITEYLRNDLTYLSLLLDDRKRGFYNTPFISKNDSENFIQKIAGELEVTLPQVAERSYIIKNTELNGESVGTGSIYHLIQKDTLITEIKASTSINKNQKINAIRDLDMQDLENTLGSQRDLENHFNYNIVQDIISVDTLTSDTLRDLFINFPIDDRQDDAELLAQVKQALSINNGSNIVSGDISLPTSLSGVTITWHSKDPSIISHTGIVAPQDQDTSAILTARLEIGNLSATKDFGLTVIPRPPTPLEELELALTLLTDHIDVSGSRFNNRIIPLDFSDFSENGGIVPNITWTGSLLVKEDGSTNKPSLSALPSNDPPSNLHQKTNVTVKLTHPTSPTTFVKKTYDIFIRREDPTPKELASATLLDAKNILNNFFNPTSNPNLRTNIPNTITNIQDIHSFSTLNGVDIKWIDTGTPLIGHNGVITHPSYNNGDKDITIKVEITTKGPVAITGSVHDIQLKIEKQACVGTIIGGECYELIASAEYNSDLELGGLSPTNTANRPGIYTINGEKGIKPLRSQGSILSYDISSLNLGNDWAIEISALGEDMKRNVAFIENGKKKFTNHGILAIPGEIFIYNREGKLNVTQATTTPFNQSIPDGFNKILLRRNKITLNSETITLNNISLSDILIGSNKNFEQQWEGIINYIKVFKKE